MKNFPINAMYITVILLGLFGMFWLSSQGLGAGQFYVTLFMFGTIIFLGVTFYKFVLNKDDRFYYKVPIDSTYNRASLLFWFGIIGGVLFLIAFQVYSGFNGGFVMSPLANFGGSTGQPLSFAALDAQNSPEWKLYTIGITAPSGEELVLGFFAVIIGAFLAYTILLGIENLRQQKFGSNFSKAFTFIVGVLISVLFFAGLHLLNGNYLTVTGSPDWAKLGWAALFRLSLNILIFLAPTFGTMFGIGVHMLINHVSLGWAAVWAGVTGGGIGWLIIFIYAWLIFSLFGVINAINKNGFMSVFKWRSPEQLG